MHITVKNRFRFNYGYFLGLGVFRDGPVQVPQAELTLPVLVLENRRHNDAFCQHSLSCALTSDATMQIFPSSPTSCTASITPGELKELMYIPLISGFSSNRAFVWWYANS